MTSHTETILAAFEAIQTERAALRDIEAPARPVEAAMRARVRDLGERIHAAGGFDAMQAVWMDVSEANRRAGSFLDRAWDGVGEWRA